MTEPSAMIDGDRNRETEQRQDPTCFGGSRDLPIGYIESADAVTNTTVSLSATRPRGWSRDPLGLAGNGAVSQGRISAQSS
jgi:hypothetical protein